MPATHFYRGSGVPQDARASGRCARDPFLSGKRRPARCPRLRPMCPRPIFIGQAASRKTPRSSAVAGGTGLQEAVLHPPPARASSLSPAKREPKREPRKRGRGGQENQTSPRSLVRSLVCGAAASGLPKGAWHAARAHGYRQVKGRGRPALAGAGCEQRRMPVSTGREVKSVIDSVFSSGRCGPTPRCFRRRQCSKAPFAEQALLQC